MPSFKTDQALWYNVGVWGELGYAVPNFGDDAVTLNEGIHYLTSVVGRNLSAIMHHPDVDLRTPPSINTLLRLHKLIVRSRQILSGRDVAPGEPDMESVHTSPAAMVHLIYPVPYFKVRNHHLKHYCGLILNALAEMMQHTENRKPYEISTRFSGVVGQYLHRVYRLMATELFGIDPEKAKALDFTLTEADLKAYDPGKWFTSTEMIDTVAPLHLVPTEDDLLLLTDGIPAMQLVGLSAYPSGAAINAGVLAGGGGASSATNSGNASFAPAPAL
jgi:hypothetical protein